MTLSLPRDFQAYSCYRRLRDMIGDNAALCLFVRLWVELGYQIDVHGGSGVFSKKEAQAFLDSLPIGPEKTAAFGSLVNSQCLIPSGEDYVCPMFVLANKDLDANYVPDSQRAQLLSAFNKRIQKIDKNAIPFTATIPPECWSVDDRIMTQEEMKRAVMLIKTIDAVLRSPDRQAYDYTPGLCQAALQVTKDYTENKLHVILRTMFIKRSTCGLNRSTEYYLNHFEDVVLKLMPDEGFIKWSKKRGVE
jgi:hypothetical protein